MLFLINKQFSNFDKFLLRFKKVIFIIIFKLISLY